MSYLKTMRRMLQRLLAALVLVTLLTGCAAADDAGPLQLARDFVAAWEDLDVTRALNLMEPDDYDWRREIMPEMRSYISGVTALKFVEPTYTMVDNNGELAHVRVAATVAYTLENNVVGDLDLDMVLEVVKLDDGRWYLRNVQLSNVPLP